MSFEQHIELSQTESNIPQIAMIIPFKDECNNSVLLHKDAVTVRTNTDSAVLEISDILTTSNQDYIDIDTMQIQ